MPYVLLVYINPRAFDGMALTGYPPGKLKKAEHSCSQKPERIEIPTP
jgi:hypothetical protein